MEDALWNCTEIWLKVLKRLRANEMSGNWDHPKEPELEELKLEDPDEWEKSKTIEAINEKTNTKHEFND